MTEYQDALRDVVATGVKNGVPTPGFSASINYYDSYRSEDLPANLIQAQRDYFRLTLTNVKIVKVYSILNGLKNN